MFIRESAPLCLAFDSRWGRVYRGWAWIAAIHTMRRSWKLVKSVTMPRRDAATDALRRLTPEPERPERKGCRYQSNDEEPRISGQLIRLFNHAHNVNPREQGENNTGDEEIRFHRVRSWW